jgi:hypothetical protein
LLFNSPFRPQEVTQHAISAPIKSDYSAVNAIASFIQVSQITRISNNQIEPSRDKRSFGVFIPLAFGSSAYSVVSGRSDFDSSSAIALSFSSRVQKYFDQSTASIDQLYDIECTRSRYDIPVFCIGECRYGNAIHPLFRSHALAHEVYLIICSFQGTQK